MAKPAILNIAKFFGRCMQALEARGITVEESSDFETCEARMSAIGKQSITPMLSSAHHDLSKDHAVWLMLRKDGEDIGGVAARHDTLRSETLSEYWARSYGRLYKGKGRLRPVPEVHRACDELSGQVVYMGEFFITKEMRGSRHLLSLYTHILFSYCQLRWDPDWLYAFVRADDARKGYATEYGFTRQYPGAHLWDILPEGRAIGEYLVAISSREFRDMATYFDHHPSSLLGADSLRRVE
ncbi:hypothetical protein [Marivita geojedonensis]|uniref:N-acetyltransferase domain-containing protein n=1 Tax=Marivita geojedonensis TaxID=1123756 RepID=A0A1X4NF61_9RHOB|nr:hypothetical protein [Marivita geojedonensis]OSQ45618.1 hypothetical protein MGEO_18040 [Marivita geojedonensis]PRY73953.1 hypothetical protein CLV76_12521 [Marivita geojedonensis]